MTDVFISYSRRDKDFARRLRDKLEERKKETWIDLKNILLTAEWKGEVYAGIDNADTFAFVISPDSVKSDNCRIEIVHAVENKKRIAPIWFRDVNEEDIPPDIRSHNWVWCRRGNDLDEAVDDLVEALDTDLGWVKSHTWLLMRARKWESEGRDSSFLLRGKDLRDAEALPAREAEKVQDNPEFWPRLTRLQLDYIRASRVATTRSRLAVFGTLAIFLIVASLGVFAWWQRNQASTTALAGQALLTSDLGGDSLQRSVLLATEAQNDDADVTTTMQATEVLSDGVALLARPVARIVHESPVYAVDYSPDGKYVATAGDDGVRLLNLESGERELLEHDSGVSNVIFSEDGKYLATATPASTDGTRLATAHVWDVESREEVATFEHAGADVYKANRPSLAFDPKGEYLATADSVTKAAYVWDIANEKQVKRFELPGTGSLVSFDPDGERLATTSLAPDGTGTVVQVWKLDGERPVARMEHDDYVTGLAFSPNQDYIATASADRFARVWEIESGEKVSRMEHDDTVYALAFGPDGNRLATASADHTARVWDVGSGEEVAQFEHEGVVNGLAFSPDGGRLATASSDGTGRVWDIATNQEVARMSHLGSVSRVAFSPDGAQVATASYDQTGRVWEVQSSSGLTVSHDGSALYGVHISPDGRYLATAGDDNTARVWDLQSGEEIRTFKHDDAVKGVVFSPDNRYLATASGNTARVWGIDTGWQISRMEHGGPLYGGIVFSPDNRYLATASADQTARVWDWKTEEEKARMKHEWGQVYSVAFSRPDGRYLATASADQTARVWDWKTEEEKARITHNAEVWDVAFSPDGKYLALAGMDGTARLWDVANEQDVGEPLPHQGEVTALNFSPDSRYLATASYDHTARIWDVESGNEVVRLRHDDQVKGVAFSPDGKYLATTSSDGTARVRSWRAGGLVDEACSRLTRNLTESEWEQFVGGPYHKTCPGLPTPEE